MQISAQHETGFQPSKQDLWVDFLTSALWTGAFFFFFSMFADCTLQQGITLVPLARKALKINSELTRIQQGSRTAEISQLSKYADSFQYYSPIMNKSSDFKLCALYGSKWILDFSELKHLDGSQQNLHNQPLCLTLLLLASMEQVACRLSRRSLIPPLLACPHRHLFPGEYKPRRQATHTLLLRGSLAICDSYFQVQKDIQIPSTAGSCLS